MKQVYLPAIGQTTSALGLGCVGLTAMDRRRDALELLECAYDCGIRHYDVARSYGMGVAETILGEFARSRRSQITITTKFGVVPPAIGQRMPFLPAIKRTLKRLPMVDRYVRRKLSDANSVGNFTPQAARESLEASLRTLQTDYIDIWLLHEASVPDACRPDLLDFLDKQKSAGLVRAFGLGSEFGKIDKDLGRLPEKHRVLQFENNFQLRNLRSIDARSGRTIITHSALKHSAAFRSLAQTEVAVVEELQAATGVDLRDPPTLHSFLLAWALRDNPAGVVLFGSRSKSHVRANSRTTYSDLLQGPVLEEFERLGADPT